MPDDDSVLGAINRGLARGLGILDRVVPDEGTQARPSSGSPRTIETTAVVLTAEEELIARIDALPRAAGAAVLRTLADHFRARWRSCDVF